MSPVNGERYDTLINQAHDALDEEEFDCAIDLAREAIGLEPHDFEGYFIAGVAFHELADYRRAIDYLHEASGRSPEDLLVRTYEARTRLFLGDDKQAEAMLRTVVENDPELAEARYWLSVVVERNGRYAEADDLLGACAKIDPECFHRPFRMGRAELEQDLEQVIKLLPSPISSALKEVAIVIEELPSSDLLAGHEPLAPDILGLFVGSSLREASVFNSPSEPNVVYLFQRNLERVSASREELLEEARLTLIHEIGHYLGLDEEDLVERGLE